MPAFGAGVEGVGAAGVPNGVTGAGPESVGGVPAIIGPVGAVQRLQRGDIVDHVSLRVVRPGVGHHGVGAAVLVMGQCRAALERMFQAEGMTDLVQEQHVRVFAGVGVGVTDIGGVGPDVAADGPRGAGVIGPGANIVREMRLAEPQLGGIRG